MNHPRHHSTDRPLMLAALAASLIVCAPAVAVAQSYAPNAPINYPVSSVFAPVLHDDTAAGLDDTSPLRRQVVDYPTRETPGTIVIDTPHTFLYLVLGNGKALRYGIGVGRQGFTWSGTETISRKAEWPDWYPPAEMVARQPYLPRFVAGGPNNPLGARALYLGHSEYRIHGTNDPSTIGHHVSSGCIRLTNADIIDLFGRVGVGTKVVVLPQTARAVPARAARTTRPQAPRADTRRTVMIPVSTTPAPAPVRPMSNSAFGLY
jgi:lipoprotein-anchoring transpeptidase ErfK/SrfK